MSDFQQTVNLKPKPEKKPKPKLKKRRPLSRAQEIDEVYKDEEEPKVNNKMHEINRPAVRESNDSVYKQAVFILVILLIGAIAYFVFWPKGQEPVNNGPVSVKTGWYLVKLMNSESYYGQIEDMGADPVVIKNVYYNYDQLNGGGENAAPADSATGNLKLVKRGKETHGPEGVMNIVRAQVVYMEELKEESKVLQAILEYEK